MSCHHQSSSFFLNNKKFVVIILWITLINLFDEIDCKLHERCKLTRLYEFDSISLTKKTVTNKLIVISFMKIPPVEPILLHN